MKKLLWVPAVAMTLTLLIGADIHRPAKVETAAEEPKKACYGYTIIEYGKGIDCHGDTIRLVKINGIQEQLKEPS